MSNNKYVLKHILDFIPKYEFNKCVDRYKGNYKTRSFSCYDQFICMMFAQLTNRESLRDIEICLHSIKNKWYHIGIRGNVSKSTLANANEKRNSNIYSDFAKVLSKRAQELYINEPTNIDLDNQIYALDSTSIDLCLSMFLWASYVETKSAIKLHTLINLRGNIPTVIFISDGRLSDVKFMDKIYWQAGAIYLMDRGYIDFTRLYKITKSGAFFVTRMKKKSCWRRLYSNKVDRESGLICDQIISLTYRESKKFYPDYLRRIKYHDRDSNQTLIFLTNNFDLPALTIANLYKQRWQVELFFKWIKQHLRITSFYGQSPNAVKNQIWIAISTYLLVAILKKTLDLEQSLYSLLQIFSISLFEKTEDLKGFVNCNYTKESNDFAEQLDLLDP